MKLGYTEFSFGYAFTENLVRASATRPSGAPVFPNLVQEAQLGYDVRIDYPGVPVFFQFKLPELMVRDTAKEIATLRLRGLSTPFFRMPLMRRDQSDQHAHLIALERDFPGAVFYASPLLETNGDFNTAYCAGSVHQQTALFSPNDIGPLPDNKSHSVAYTSGSILAWRCSEPKEVKLNTYDNLDLTLSNRLTERKDTDFEGSIQEVRRKIDRFLPSSIRQAEDQLRGRILERRSALEERAEDVARPDDVERVQHATTELLVVRELARIGLGVDLLMAQPRQ
ncbi:hypothetical protein [Aliiroseovarius sp. S253]|uniref:hypothetical protein n=1 Tax=Aliiroseovarius sp. S253 TaxID=3415133 RepID=UPI003C7B2375